MVKALPVVRSGERVKIIITSGSMILTATGLAYSDGQINQMIRVQNLRSRKIVYCRVAAPGLVEVLL
jgi:flagella basal body P-ring formation protein FlgA